MRAGACVYDSIRTRQAHTPRPTLTHTRNEQQPSLQGHSQVRSEKLFYRLVKLTSWLAGLCAGRPREGASARPNPFCEPRLLMADDWNEGGDASWNADGQNWDGREGGGGGWGAAGGGGWGAAGGGESGPEEAAAAPAAGAGMDVVEAGVGGDAKVAAPAVQLKRETLGEPREGERPLVVRTHTGDLELLIYLSDSKAGVKTAGDLAALLQRDYGVPASDELCQRGAAGDADENLLDNDEPLRADLSPVYTRLQPINLTVQHKGASYKLNKVTMSTRIEELARQVMQAASESGTIELTKEQESEERGMDGKMYKRSIATRLDGRTTLKQARLLNNMILEGLRSFEIVDNHDAHQPKTVTAYAYQTLSELIAIYLKRVPRQNHADSGLVYEGRRYTLESATNQTLAGENIESGVQLVYDSKPFPIRITEGSQGDPVTIQVEDHDNVKSVKEKYVRRVNENNNFQVTSPDDVKLIFNGHLLDDDQKKVYMYQLNAQSEVIAQHERGEERTRYLCTNCGATIGLKRNEAVICPECKCRIVQKKRSAEVRQLLAR